MSYDGSRVRAGTLFRGYEQAFVRFQRAAEGRAPEPAFHALFEALNWAVAIDDVVAEIWRPAGARERYKWRGRVPGGDVMDGIRLVRNLVHHHWADALRLEEGMSSPLRDPIRNFSWKWRRAEELPPPTHKRDKARVPMYQSVLADRHAEGTLISLADAFEWVGRLLETPRATPPQPVAES